MDSTLLLIVIKNVFVILDMTGKETCMTMVTKYMNTVTAVLIVLVSLVVVS